jgi:hypothetical protein
MLSTRWRNGASNGGVNLVKYTVHVSTVEAAERASAPATAAFAHSDSAALVERVHTFLPSSSNDGALFTCVVRGLLAETTYTIHVCYARGLGVPLALCLDTASVVPLLCLGFLLFL